MLIHKISFSIYEAKEIGVNMNPVLFLHITSFRRIGVQNLARFCDIWVSSSFFRGCWSDDISNFLYISILKLENWSDNKFRFNDSSDLIFAPQLTYAEINLFEIFMKILHDITWRHMEIFCIESAVSKKALIFRMQFFC